MIYLLSNHENLDIFNSRKLYDTMSHIKLYVFLNNINFDELCDIICKIYNTIYEQNQLECDRIKKIITQRKIGLNEKSYKSFAFNYINRFNNVDELKKYNDSIRISSKDFGFIFPDPSSGFKIKSDDEKSFLVYIELVNQDILIDKNKEFIVNMNIEFLKEEEKIFSSDMNKLNTLNYKNFELKYINNINDTIYNEDNTINIERFKTVLYDNNFDKFYDYLNNLCERINKDEFGPKPMDYKLKYIKYKLKYLELKKMNNF
jgi:hypothetical protein